MAARKTNPGISTPDGQKSVDEVKFNIQSQNNEDFRIQKVYDLINNQLHLDNLSKTSTRTFSSFSKDKLRTYLKNPKTNEDNLRQLSKFLYRYCYPYRRLIWYNSTMINAKAYTVVPIVDITKTANTKKVIKTFYKTAVKMNQIALDECILPMLLTAWREDTAFGYIYDDDETFFIHVLDGKYCKVSSIDGGTLRYAFDFSYFNAHKDDLEYWDSEFTDKYNAYASGSAYRWQELDYSREICLKVNIDDPTMAYPPFAPLFESIIDLVDLQSIQSVKDELSIYKLLVARLEPITGTDIPDDFSVDPKTALSYYDKFQDNLPDCVASCISPMKIDPIEFKGNDTSDVDMISDSTNNLFKNAGGSQILGSEKTGTTITNAQIIADAESAISSLLPQIQKWCNAYLKLVLGSDKCNVKFIRVTPYTVDSVKKNMLESGTLGIPDKIAIASLSGTDPLETLSMAVLENDCLELHNKWIPLQSSYTQSASGISAAGRPVSDDGDLTDDGSKSRENK